MRYNSPTNSNSYFSTRGDNNYIGDTRSGLHCTSNNPTLIFSQDLTEILDANKNEDWTGYNPLPLEGEEVIYNTIYSDGATLVLSRMTHTRSSNPVDDEPDLFITHKDFGTPIGWFIGEHVGIGIIRVYDNKNYKVLQSHVTQDDWTPDITPALWLEVVEEGGGIPDWVKPIGGHDAYNIGDEVMFEDIHYRSLIDANVWSPTEYPTGWETV